MILFLLVVCLIFFAYCLVKVYFTINMSFFDTSFYNYLSFFRKTRLFNNYVRQTIELHIKNKDLIFFETFFILFSCFFKMFILCFLFIKYAVYSLYYINSFDLLFVLTNLFALFFLNVFLNEIIKYSKFQYAYAKNSFKFYYVIKSGDANIKTFPVDNPQSIHTNKENYIIELSDKNIKEGSADHIQQLARLFFFSKIIASLGPANISIAKKINQFNLFFLAMCLFFIFILI